MTWKLTYKKKLKGRYGKGKGNGGLNALTIFESAKGSSKEKKLLWSLSTWVKRSWKTCPASFSHGYTGLLLGFSEVVSLFILLLALVLFPSALFCLRSEMEHLPSQLSSDPGTVNFQNILYGPYVSIFTASALLLFLNFCSYNSVYCFHKWILWIFFPSWSFLSMP